MLTAAWRNPADALDVDGDGVVAPRDALMVINELFSRGSINLEGEGEPSGYYLDVDGDGYVAPGDALQLFNFLNRDLIGARRVLREHGPWNDSTEIVIGLGQIVGSRTYELGIDAAFARGANAAAPDDRLEVTLVDPADGRTVLLDGGAPGTPLFALQGDVAEYGSSVAGWDGQVLTIDLSALQNRTSGLLRVRLFDLNDDRRSRVFVRPIANTVEPTGSPMSSYPADERPPVEGSQYDAPPTTVSAFSAFAQWGDKVVESQRSVTQTLALDSSRFTFPWGGVILGLTAQAAPGESLDPGVVTVAAVGAGRGRTLLQSSQTAAGRDSVALVRLGPGEFQAEWQSDLDTSGVGRLRVFLAGDANGDFQVDTNDVALVESLNGVQAGQSSYRIDADVNRDGRIDRTDSRLTRLNLGATTTVRPIVAIASLAPDADLNGNGVVLQASTTVNVQSRPGATIHTRTIGATTNAVGAQSTGVTDAQGRYSFSTPLVPGANRLEVTASDAFGQSATVERTVVFGDVVQDWNAALLNVIRDWTTLSNDPYTNRIVTERPPVAARNLAMVHAAMYGAVQAVEGEYQPYVVDVTADPGASAIAAAAAAAYRTATQLYTQPDELAVFEASLAEALATVADPTARTAGVAAGERAGDQVIGWRFNDGATAAVAYVPGAEPGDWRRTFPDYLPPLLPQWPAVLPFAMDSGDQFRSPPPPTLDSSAYAAAVDEVMRLGRFDSQERTADQTQSALFWADGGGTFTPPGHWNQIASDAVSGAGRSLVDNARLFALLNIALADAGIASWDSKYEYELWRPIDAIRQADLDGNSATAADPDWIPLLKSPPFPSYSSGHSTFSGAASAVLTALLGDDFEFVSRADGHEGFTQRPLADRLVVTRSFDSFDAAAEEAGRSRIYGGIHFEFDNQAGLTAGRSIGRMVVEQFMRPLGAD